MGLITIKDNTREKAILVAINPQKETIEKVEEYLDELEMLADTAGADALFKVIQDRQRRDPAFYIGKGKAEEVCQLAEMNECSLIIFDDDLTPTQVRNLEKMSGRKILDRSGLILDIFAAHAKTNEAKTQVELAQLEYMLPRLTRAWTHLQKQYGGVGTRGPGETQIETDRRLIRNRITKLKSKLDKIELQHETQGMGRKGFITASLVGYTNAGKSTLINKLTDAGVLAENKLFATLDSTTRSLELNKNNKLLISDTVGFIRKLPHNLVASFRSTFKVVRDADLILHVVDVTHPYFEEHIDVVNRTLKQMKCEDKQQLLILNKVDALEDKEKLDYVKSNFTDAILVSAMRGMNISGLLEKITVIIEENYVEAEVKLAFEDARFESDIYNLAEVLNKSYDEDSISIRYRTDKVNNQKIERLLNAGKQTGN